MNKINNKRIKDDWTKQAEEQWKRCPGSFKKTQQHKNVLTMAFKFSDIESQCKAIKPCNTNPAASEGRRSSLKTENGRKNFVLNYLMKG